MDDLTPLLDAYQSGGWMAVAGVAVTLGVRILRRDSVQRMLINIDGRLAWERWPVLMRWCVIFGAAALASVLGAIAAGETLKAALLAAIPVALGAVGLHTGTQTAGYAMHHAALEKDPYYVPGVSRKGLDIVLPLDPAVIAAARGETYTGPPPAPGPTEHTVVMPVVPPAKEDVPKKTEVITTNEQQ